MANSRVFLFCGTQLVVPDHIGDDEAALGVDQKTADSAFGALDYYAVPSLEPSGVVSPNEPSENHSPVKPPQDEPVRCFLFDDDIKIPLHWKMAAVRQLLPRVSEAFAIRILRAYHIVQWRRDSRYCGSCGGPNGDSPDELARLCPRCGRIEYPRISPAVIVLIIGGSGGALLAHNKKFRERMYSLIAGFVEAGESLEAAVHREIKEELGIEVQNVRYIKSQSWPFPNAMMLGFTARFAGGDIKPDGIEIVDARWFSRETIRQSAEAKQPAKNSAASNHPDGELIPEIPSHGSISRYLIDEWLKGNVE